MQQYEDSDADDDSAYGLSTCEISSVLVRTKWLAHRFFDACDSDRAFKANAHALAIVPPLTMSAIGTFDVELLGTPGLRLLIVTAGSSEEELFDPEALVDRASMAMENMHLPGSIDYDRQAWELKRALNMVAVVASGRRHELHDELQTTSQHLACARSSLGPTEQGRARITAGLRFLRCAYTWLRRGGIEPEPAPEIGFNETHLVMEHEVQDAHEVAVTSMLLRTCDMSKLQELTSMAEMMAERSMADRISIPKSTASAVASEATPWLYLVQALLTIIQPPPAFYFKSGWQLPVLSIDDLFDLELLKGRAREVVAKQCDDAAPFPMRSLDDRAPLISLLHIETIAAAILDHVDPREHFAFKMTCRRFRAAQMSTWTPPGRGSRPPERGSNLTTRTSFGLFVERDRPELMEWAISVGAPWPTGRVRLRLKLNYKNVVNVSTDLTELDSPRWHLFTELRMERELTTPTNALTGMNSAWTGARRRIVSLCAAAGSLAMLRWARSLPVPCPWDEEEFSSWDEEEFPSLPSRPCELAAGGGHLATLEWLREQHPTLPWGNTLAVAASGGHERVFEWALAAGAGNIRNQSVLLAAGQGGSFPILHHVWAAGGHELADLRLSVSVVAETVESGDASTISWLFEEVLPPHKWPAVEREHFGWVASIWSGAAARGRLAVLQTLHEIGFVKPQEGMHSHILLHASNGTFNHVREDLRAHLHSTLCSRFETSQKFGTMLNGKRARREDAAAAEALEWLHAHLGLARTPDTHLAGTEASLLAAAKGSLRCLQWLHVMGWVVDARVGCVAASRGRVEMLEWLDHVGCPFDERTWHIASRRARKWLEAHGCCYAADADREFIEKSLVHHALYEELRNYVLEAIPRLATAQFGDQAMAPGGRIGLLRWARDELWSSVTEKLDDLTRHGGDPSTGRIVYGGNQPPWPSTLPRRLAPLDVMDEAVSYALAMWACIGDALDKAIKAAGLKLGPHTFDEVRSILARVEGVGDSLRGGHPTEFAASTRLRRATVVALQWWVREVRARHWNVTRANLMQWARTAGRVHIRSPSW